MIFHCFFPTPTKESSTEYKYAYLLIALIDVGLTSNIAVGFMWAGLSDLKVVDDKSLWTKLVRYYRAW